MMQISVENATATLGERNKRLLRGALSCAHGEAGSPDNRR